MTETIGQGDAQYGYIFFLLIALPIALAFLAPVIGHMTMFVVTLWHCRKPRVITERVYVNTPTTVYRTITAKPSQSKQSSKDPEFFDDVVAALHALGTNKNQAKELVRKTYDEDSHLDTNSLLRDCISQL